MLQKHFVVRDYISLHSHFGLMSKNVHFLHIFAKNNPRTIGDKKNLSKIIILLFSLGLIKRKSCFARRSESYCSVQKFASLKYIFVQPKSDKKWQKTGV